jgi:voltage-gated potassium channel
MYLKIKRKIYLLLDPFDGGTNWDRVVNTFIVILIILNTLAVIFETVNSFYLRYQGMFKYFEIFSVFVFSIEYLLRIWTCTLADEFKGPVKGRLKYIVSFGGIVDLISILPFYLPVLAGYDLRFIRMLRLFRFFKLGRFLHAVKVISSVLHEKKDELLISLSITLSLIIVASCMMYFVEHGAQPAKFASIPETMWWSVSTLTTVGYGDMYPITPLGKTLTACLSILGIGMFALPAGILASGFSDVMRRHKSEQNYCPHCGKELQ